MLFDLFDFFHSREISKPGDSRSELNVKFDRRLRSTGCDMNELSKLMASKLWRWMWVLDMLHNVPDTKLSICPVSRELPNWVGFFCRIVCVFAGSYRLQSASYYNCTQVRFHFSYFHRQYRGRDWAVTGSVTGSPGANVSVQLNRRRASVFPL